MPIERIKSGPDESDLDAIQGAVHKVEAAGGRVVQVLSWGGYPVSEIVLLVEKAGRKLETRRQP